MHRDIRRGAPCDELRPAASEHRKFGVLLMHGPTRKQKEKKEKKGFEACEKIVTIPLTKRRNKMVCQAASTKLNVKLETLRPHCPLIVQSTGKTELSSYPRFKTKLAF